jgi:hypothetical protein
MCLTPYQRLRLLETRRITQQARICGPERQESEMSFLKRVWKSKSFFVGLGQIAVGGILMALQHPEGGLLIATGINTICGKDATAKVNEKIDEIQKKVDEVQAMSKSQLKSYRGPLA